MLLKTHMLDDKIIIMSCSSHFWTLKLFSSNCLHEYGEHIRETSKTEPQEQNDATDYSAMWAV